MYSRYEWNVACIPGVHDLLKFSRIGVTLSITFVARYSLYGIERTIFFY